MDQTNTGWFGSFTTGLGQLAGIATPIISAVNGNKAGVANGSPSAGTAAGSVATVAKNVGGITTKTMLLIGGGIALLLGLVFVLTRKR